MGVDLGVGVGVADTPLNLIPQTPRYVQGTYIRSSSALNPVPPAEPIHCAVTGFITQELVNIAADDDGGEMDVSPGRVSYFLHELIGI